MGVYIKSLDMPFCCLVCPCSGTDNTDDENEVWVCEASELRRLTTKDKIERRPEWCPLVPVPKHGRLIEDTAVREQIDEWLDSVGDVVVGHGLSYYGELLGCIEDAPTIIPAEGGE